MEKNGENSLPLNGTFINSGSLRSPLIFKMTCFAKAARIGTQRLINHCHTHIDGTCSTGRAAQPLIDFELCVQHSYGTQVCATQKFSPHQSSGTPGFSLNTRF